MGKMHQKQKTTKSWCKTHRSRRLLVGLKRVNEYSKASNPVTVKRDVHPPSNEWSKRKTKPARFTRPNCFKVVADLVMGFRSPGGGIGTPSLSSAQHSEGLRQESCPFPHHLRWNHVKQEQPEASSSPFEASSFHMMPQMNAWTSDHDP